MKTQLLNLIYLIGLFFMTVILGIKFTFMVFCLSLLIALMPLATNRFMFGLPVVLTVMCFIFPFNSLYDKDFALLSIIYAPFHHIMFSSGLIKLSNFLSKN